MIESGEALQLLDVRSTREFAGGHIPGAINVPVTELGPNDPRVKPNAPTVLICHSGMRADMCYGKLKGAVRNLTVLEGGTMAWKGAGLPLEGQKQRSVLPVGRQVQTVAGTLALTGVLGSVFLAPDWLWLSGIVGAGLLMAGLTGFCPMALLVERMPWNR